MPSLLAPVRYRDKEGREVRGMPQPTDYPGKNPYRRAAEKVLYSWAMDPTNVEVGPLGMTRALKGLKVYHGTNIPARVTEIHPAVKKLLRSEDIVEPGKAFRHFDPEAAGSGAGGDLWGRGIYLTEHPEIAAGYSKRSGVGGWDTGNIVRTHNIPPQAKILDIHKPLSRKEAGEIIRAFSESLGGENPQAYAKVLEDQLDKKAAYWKENPKTTPGPNYNTADLFKEVIGHTVMMPPTMRRLGYDGISFKAGEVMGLPKGVPAGTRNYVIYNYDIINNPRSLLPEPKGEPSYKYGKRPIKEVYVSELPSTRAKQVSPDAVTPFELHQLIGTGMAKGPKVSLETGATLKPAVRRVKKP